MKMIPKDSETPSDIKLIIKLAKTTTQPQPPSGGLKLVVLLILLLFKSLLLWLLLFNWFLLFIETFDSIDRFGFRADNKLLLLLIWLLFLFNKQFDSSKETSFGLCSKSYLIIDLKKLNLIKNILCIDFENLLINGCVINDIRANNCCHSFNAILLSIICNKILLKLILIIIITIKTISSLRHNLHKSCAISWMHL